jgi:multiple sugar transport system substrate-binding protein
VIGSAVAAAGASAPRWRSAGAQDATPFSGEASITSWGFGAEETNPMAFTRIEAFREAYPNIEIELVPEFDDQKLLTGFASDQLPDVLWMDRARIASWAARGVLSPLDEFFSESGIDTGKYYPSAIDQVTYEGQVYGLPQFIDVRALYVNLDALEEVGQDPAELDTGNWEALSDLGAQLIVAEGDRVERWGFDHKMQAGFIWMWGQGNGGEFMSEDGQTLTFNDPAVVEALDWGVQAYEAQGGFQLYESVATTWQGDEHFARGQVAMTAYENWMLGIVARVAPDLNFTVLPINAHGGTDPISISGGPAWCIPNGAPNPEAAWAFIEFMDRLDTWRIGAAGVKEFQESEGRPYIPSLTGNPEADQMQIEEFYEPIAPQFDEAVSLWPQILEQSFIVPVSKTPVSSQLLDIMQQEGVMPALRGELSAEEALTNANESAQEALEEA